MTKRANSLSQVFVEGALTPCALRRLLLRDTTQTGGYAMDSRPSLQIPMYHGLNLESTDILWRTPLFV